MMKSFCWDIIIGLFMGTVLTAVLVFLFFLVLGWTDDKEALKVISWAMK